MKVVLDTNVLISGTFWDGDSNRIIEKIENKELILFITKEIIEEFVRVLQYEEIQNKIKNKNLEMKRTVEKIISLSIIIMPLEKFDIIKDDPEDNKFLDCAFCGNVDLIISKDKHLLKLCEFKGVKIITPEKFVQDYD